MQFRRKPASFRKLLVVDDDARLLASYQDLLVPYGFEVLTADSGAKAVTLVEKNPDLTLIILDVVMPGMDGHEFLAWFRKRQKELPVIVISAHEFEAVGEDATPSAVLRKPFHVAELLDLVGLFCGLSVTSTRSM